MTRMTGMVVAGAAAGTLTLAAHGQLTPIVDSRVVHAQGSVVPAAGEAVFVFDAQGAEPFAPWSQAVVASPALPGISFESIASQSSEVEPTQLSAGGTASATLSTIDPQTVAAGNACSHYVLTFDVVDTVTCSLAGEIDIADDAAGLADGWVIIKVQRLADAAMLIDETLGSSGSSMLDYALVLQPGLYDIVVEAHVSGMLQAPAAATASSSFEVTLTAASICPDLDGDGVVAVQDMLMLLGSWGPVDCEPQAPGCPDLDGDGTVGVPDFLDLLGAWGPCP